MTLSPQLYEEVPVSGEPFTRLPNRLVDFDDYLPYLVDHPDGVPVQPGKGEHRDWHPQHAHFTETAYRQLGIPNPLDRDMRLVAFRNVSWFQIIMRAIQEKKLHRDKEPEVEPPPITVVEQALDDTFDLDIVGAATLGIEDTLHPKKTVKEGSDKYLPPPEVVALSKTDRVRIFEARRDEALERLFSPRALPPRMVTSGIKRLSVALRDPVLKSVARQRLKHDETYYPLRVPKLGTLRAIGGVMLADAVGLKQLEDAKYWNYNRGSREETS